MAGPPTPRERPRACGLRFGPLPTGAHNAITDVAGVRVGHRTVWREEATGAGVGRSGVTAIVPDELAALFRRPLAAGTAVLNGAGELTGSLEIAEWGTLETPILLTGTPTVGRAYDAAVDAVFAAVPEAGRDDFVIPVVGECDDSWLDDARARHVTVADVRAAIDGAVEGPVAGGVVGAGTGMVSFGCKAGIGTSSRFVEALGYTVGVLLLANFGTIEQLRVLGVPVGERLAAAGFVDAWREPAGSCIGIVATDAPVDRHQCARLARRVGLGLARVGSVAHHGSGEIFAAFSTTRREDRRPAGVGSIPTLGDGSLDELFDAVVDATEEAVLDALFRADTVSGRDGNTAPALPVADILPWL